VEECAISVLLQPLIIMAPMQVFFPRRRSLVLDVALKCPQGRRAVVCWIAIPSCACIVMVPVPVPDYASHRDWLAMRGSVEIDRDIR